MECELCGKDVPELFHTLFTDGDKKSICRACLDIGELQADMEYERQREEGGYFGQCESDHERDGDAEFEEKRDREREERF